VSEPIQREERGGLRAFEHRRHSPREARCPLRGAETDGETGERGEAGGDAAQVAEILVDGDAFRHAAQRFRIAPLCLGHKPQAADTVGQGRQVVQVAEQPDALLVMEPSARPVTATKRLHGKALERAR
jgi:hypothetical protein